MPSSRAERIGPRFAIAHLPGHLSNNPMHRPYLTLQKPFIYTNFATDWQPGLAALIRIAFARTPT
jgi:hypothetical protein